MPYKSEKIRLPRTLDRRVKLSDEDKEKIVNLYPEMSQRKLAKLFNVSRRLISFIIDPKKLNENKDRLVERGGWSVYYKKEKHRVYMDGHRKYKQKLFTDGKIEC